MHTKIAKELDAIDEGSGHSLLGFAELASDFLESTLSAMFPQLTGGKKDTEGELLSLEANLNKLLSLLNKPLEITTSFLEFLPKLKAKLFGDAKAILEADPAAKSLEEVIICYPGFYAICVQRIAHMLEKSGVQLLARYLTEQAHTRTGIDIHPGATIGERFCIDHGTGVVIGETTIIGNDVKLYQGVTLGGLSVQKNLASKKRHPTIEDNVVIYSNAVILGGDTVIGKASIIGGNVWLPHSVPENSVVEYEHQQLSIKPRKR